MHITIKLSENLAKAVAISQETQEPAVSQVGNSWYVNVTSGRSTLANPEESKLLDFLRDCGQLNQSSKFSKSDYFLITE